MFVNRKRGMEFMLTLAAIAIRRIPRIHVFMF